MEINVQELKFVHYKMLENKIKVKKFDIISLFLILIFFGIDRISKIGVIKKIQSEQGDIFLNDFINITLNWNQGIAFGLFSLDTSFLYHLISAIILIIIVSVAIFGLLVFVFIKNYLRNKINQLVKEEKDKKLK